MNGASSTSIKERTMSATMSRMSQRARAAANSAWTSKSGSTLGLGGESPNREKQASGSPGRRSSANETAEEAVARKFPTLSFEPAGALAPRGEGEISSVDTSGPTNPFDDTEEKVEKTVFTNIEENTQSFARTAGHTEVSHVSGQDEDVEPLPPTTSSVFPLVEDDLGKERIMSELGTGRSASWRIPIYGDFEQLQEGGVVKRPTFLEFMCERGLEAEWCHAAFTAFDSRKSGGLDQFQFLLAVSALIYNRGGSAEMSTNPRWLAMRQLLVYNLMVQRNEESEVGGGVSYSSFSNFLQVLSESEESPMYFGIGNDIWSRLAGSSSNARTDSGSSSDSGATKMRTTLDIMDQSTLAESLAISKVQLATKQEQYEKLELSYLKLEKLHTQLKLELAEVKAEKDMA